MRSPQGYTARGATMETRDRPGILVVDDEPMIRNIMVELLERRGFRGWSAANGQSAVETFRKHHGEITLVLAEASLATGLTGPELLESLQSIDPCVRCCFMNSTPWSSVDSELLDRGAEEVFPKPFPPAEVVARLWDIAEGGI